LPACRGGIIQEMIHNAIILAGGYGTRLKSVVDDLPKPMADINGKPFLEYLFNFISGQGIENVILSVGYKYQDIRDYFGLNFNGLGLFYSIENEPLGTGGAIHYAIKNFLLDSAEPVFIINGDTFFEIDFNSLYNFHLEKEAHISIALKNMNNFERYGMVTINNEQRIICFTEKKFTESGTINAGIYILNTGIFSGYELPNKFSLERDFFEKYLNELRIYGKVFDGYFIDIGLPEDYERAKRELVNL